ncbi:MAG: glycoside hydrolase family 38 C-terminal domain-containing protein [Candidatus Aminicenantes bacterium]|jgi:alpha-mannosidase
MKTLFFFRIYLAFFFILGAFLSVSYAGHLPSNQARLSPFSFDELRERIQSEIKFAREFIKFYPDQERIWQKLAAEAEAVVAKVWDNSSLAEFQQAVREAEDILSPIGQAAKTHTIHCVGHAHIDMNWMWSWPETVSVTHDTFTTVLKLMEEFPDFCFTQSQASVYALIKQYDPGLFARIKKRVDEGRWEVAAVQWVEGDKNLASGESLARHLLYTRQFTFENFDLSPDDSCLDWEPDTFGHALTIPAIVSRGGVKYYYMCRGGDFEKPPIFWWQAPDGSRILVNLETTWYISTIGPHNALEFLDFLEETGLRDWMKVYGVGDHGGGPTRADILSCLEMDTWPIFPRFKMSTARDYFALLEEHKDKFPVLDQELNFEFPGCYTSQSQIKQFNRLGENQAVEAETSAALAHLICGREYPNQQLKNAWINVLFGHFHDILPGSGVRATRQYQSGLFQETAAALNMIKSNSLKAIAGRIDTSFPGTKRDLTFSRKGEQRSLGAGAGRGTAYGYLSSAIHQKKGALAFVVFNPTAWPRSETVQVTVWDAETEVDSSLSESEKPFIVRSSSGKILPTQQVKSGNYWGHHYTDLVIPVSVGPLGYGSYCIEESQTSSDAGAQDDEFQVKFVKEELGFENGFLSIGFDRLTGGIVRLIDKRTGLDLADPEDPMGIVEYVLERPGSMSAWIVHDPKKIVYPLELDSLEVVQSGRYLASIQAEARLNQSEIYITYTLKAGEPWLEIAVEAFWLERGSAETGIPGLRMRFPTGLSGAEARYEIPFGSIERPLNQGEEVPALRWAEVSGNLRNSKRKAGLVLLNDCKYGHSLNGSTLGLTLIRSSYSPDPLPEFGAQSMRVAVVPHSGDLSPSEMVRLGASFNHPLQIIYTDTHKGSLPSNVHFLMSCEQENVIISSVKKAEQEDGIILRLFETDGKNGKASVLFNASLLGKIAGVEEVDLLERPLQNDTARLTNKGIDVEVPAYSIVSLKLNFQK